MSWLNPFEAIGSFFAKLLIERRLEKYLKAFISVAISTFVTVPGVWGIAILSGMSFLQACATAAIANSAITITLWIRNVPEIPIAWPGSLEKERTRILVDENIVSHGDKK